MIPSSLYYWRAIQLQAPLSKNLLTGLLRGDSFGYLRHQCCYQYRSTHHQISSSHFHCSRNRYSGLESVGPTFGRYPRYMSSKMGDKQSKQKSTDDKPSPASQQGASVQGSSSEEFVEAIVAKTSDVPEGQMLEVKVGEDGEALLIHQNGKFTAVGNKCTHYGAPLAKGCLGNGRVRCPWHGACFNVGTGDIEDYPGLDNLASYTVRVEGEDIIVKADKKLLKAGRRPVAVTSSSSSKDKTLVIVGGGPASVVCMETLRQEGYNGRVILCCRESTLPYDRPKLSKAMHLTASEITLKPEAFYKERNIELQLGKEVTKVNSSEKSITFSDGSSLKYTTLVLATGGKPRTLPVPGFKENVHLLREPSQANSIAAEAKAS